ncbi:MAG: IS30 family transposase [Nonlabens sp.]|jgi:IS30 family transposase
MSHLNSEQRCTISVLIEQNYKKNEITVLINKDRSAITSKLKPNSDLGNGKYSSQLDKDNNDKHQLEKPKKLCLTTEVKATIRKYLLEDFSAAQIIGICEKTGIDCVPAEQIYQHI